MGIVRIGTFQDFRGNEHGKGIADEGEGVKQVSETLHGVSGRFPDSRGFHALRHFGTLDALGIDSTCEADVYIDGITLTKTVGVEDSFVFCTSTICSRQVMAEFEGADSCLEISNPGAFIKDLTSALNAVVPVELVVVSEVHYTMREENWNGRNWGMYPGLIKKPEYKGQNELRAIWRPLYHAIAPIILMSQHLTKHCREVVHIPDRASPR